MRERFEQLRQMGIKTVMCTGITVNSSNDAKEGVDEFVAECKPEDKIAVIKAEQDKGNL